MWASIRLKRREADEPVHAGQPSWPKARSSTGTRAISTHLREQQHARHETGQLTDREYGGAAGEPDREAAVGHPPVGREQQPEPEQRPAPTRTVPSTAARLGPVAAVGRAGGRAVMSPGCRFR